MSKMFLSETAVVFECPNCGHMEIIDSKMGEQPPEECSDCTDIAEAKRFCDVAPELVDACRAALITSVGTVKALELVIAKADGK